MYSFCIFIISDIFFFVNMLHIFNNPSQLWHFSQLLLCAGIEGKDYEWKDGVRVSLIDNMTNAEKAAAKRTPGSPLWGEILPRVQLPSGDASREVWEQQQRDGGKTDLKIAALEKAMDYQEWTPLMIDNFLAMATDEKPRPSTRSSPDFRPTPTRCA